MLGEVAATGWGDELSTCAAIQASNSHVHLAGAAAQSSAFKVDGTTALDAWDATNQAETAPACTETWNIADRIV